MKDIIARFTSRKFLLAVSSALYFYANHQYTELAGVIIAYIGAEGSADVVGRFADAKYSKVAQDAQTLFGDLMPDDNPDKSRVVAGNDPAIGATKVYPPTP